MNIQNRLGSIFQKIYSLSLIVKRVLRKRICTTFSTDNDRASKSITKIYVINLDRQQKRWTQMQSELGSFLDDRRNSLLNITERFSAIDARKYVNIGSSDIRERYRLGDQLFVEPNPILSNHYANDDQPVDMTKQEIAVAMSHINIWKKIAEGRELFSLILEDDTTFDINFSNLLDEAWLEIIEEQDGDQLDLLYLSYVEVKGGAKKINLSKNIFKPERGLWCLSGYVLSKNGAKKLLENLPVRGPIDLWINFYFDKLNVLATARSIINQRRDLISDNSYSILPVLTKIGVLNDTGPSKFPLKKLRDPVFVFGDEASPLTSVAMALKMMGFRCCSDSDELPSSELQSLLEKRSRVFDAYVNIGVLEKEYKELFEIYKGAKFIFMCEQFNGSENSAVAKIFSYVSKLTNSFLVLPNERIESWEELCNFLECDPPDGSFPNLKNRGQRKLSKSPSVVRPSVPMKYDISPWGIIRKDWKGFVFEASSKSEASLIRYDDDFSKLCDRTWELLSDTFPSNLALFDPKNFSIDGGGAKIVLKKENIGVRSFKSASFRSKNFFLYGSFSAVIKPPKASGVITGIFLHRNSPRQEIDIEFLGRDTTKMLVNVFYNPGDEGARFDYGYRGSPELIDLGFDASEDFHEYRIDWTETTIRWFVDGCLVHERYTWNPTPIPHLPMQLYVNLWPSRSEELAGKLVDLEIEGLTMEIGSTSITTSQNGMYEGNFRGN